MKQTILCCLMFFACSQIFGQDALRLKTGTVQLQPIDQKQAARLVTDLPVAEGKKYCIVQFGAIPASEKLVLLKNAGISVHDYLGSNCYEVSFPQQLDYRVFEQFGVKAAGALQPAQKLHFNLTQQNLPAWATDGQGNLHVLVLISGGINLSGAKALLAKQNFEVSSNKYDAFNIIEIKLTATQLTALAGLPFVSFIQPASPADQTLNHKVRPMGRASFANAPLVKGGRNLQGSGVTIGVGDDADPTLHPDLYDRVTNRTWGFVNDHGAHVAGTIGGAGIIDERRRGFAPLAGMVSQFFQGIWLNAGTYVNDHNMVLTNNSYGGVQGEAANEGYYDLYARMLDLQAFQYENLLHVFASGNDGEVDVTPYPHFYGNILSGYQCAKNVVTVGRVDDWMYASGTSSSGPVRDGRLKPEITTLGAAIISCKGFYNIGFPYWTSWGTSMSAPAVTGGLALLYERYKQLHGGVNPKGGLMKTVLLNGAMDIGKAGPDFRHGYGNLDVERGILMLENNRYATSIIATGAQQTNTFNVPAGTGQVKIMLYWHDPAAAVLASQALVNDLDLEVVTPTGSIIYPQKLDTIPGNVMLAAASGPDHINNNEQVVINTPAPGTYTIRVKGTAIQVNPSQEYFIAWDVLPAGLSLASPFGGDAYTPADQVYVHWSDYGTGVNTYTLESSVDNGANWAVIDNNISDTQRWYVAGLPDVATTRARFRIRENNTSFSSTSDTFTIIGLPGPTVAPFAEQCEGSFKMYWTAVAGATDYEVLMKRGAAYISVATTTLLNHTFSGLHKDSLYYFAVRARLNGVPGRRATAIEWRPSDGGCSGTAYDNDLKLDAIVSPVTGRQFTSTALTASTNLQIRIKNLDDAPASSFEIKYSINNSSFVTIPVTAPLAPGGTHVQTITSINFSNTGNYIIKAVVKNTGAADNNLLNDTLVQLVKHIPNAAVGLSTPYIENFDNAADAKYRSNITGVDGMERWDFSAASPQSRLRTFIGSYNPHSGSRTATLDADKYADGGTINFLTGTFNLASFNAATDEVRMDFWFKHHGPEQTAAANNKVWVRGNDGAAWIEAYDIGLNQPKLPGTWTRSASIELGDWLQNNAQNFSPSTQLRFGQEGAFSAADNDHYSGYSFDDVRLYTVNNDVQALAVDTPIVSSCGLGSNVPVKVRVRNSMRYAISNIPIRLSVDGGIAVVETIPAIAANSTIVYTFSTPANLSASGNHFIKIYTDLPADDFKGNDTTSIQIVNQPVINNFPYLQDFESGNGSFYAEGLRSSWQFGTPASIKLKAAASGSNCWKTSLQGGYNEEELSYLYSPCFNTSGLANPTLSFSMAYDIEDCSPYGVICDAAWMEYSLDGKTWQRLGASGAGTNWYDNAAFQIWERINRLHWHVATTALPASSNLRLRFVMNSDAGVNREGVAIDDIHIYDKNFDIYTAAPVSNAVTQTVSGTGIINFTDAGQIIASIQPNNNNLGATEVKAFRSDTAFRTDNKQYYAPRNITIKPTNRSFTNTSTVRFYFLDAEVDSLRKATGCSNCTVARDYTKLGITKYDNNVNKNLENGFIGDNSGGLYAYYNSLAVKKIPYGAGYYAEFPVNQFSEFWLTDGTNVNAPLPVEWLLFTAVREAGHTVRLNWAVSNEKNIRHYEVQVAKGKAAYDAGLFETIDIVDALNISYAQYVLRDSGQPKQGTYFYRIRQMDNNGRTITSELRQVSFDKADFIVKLFPNPVRDNLVIAVQAAEPKLLQVQLINTAGQILYNQPWRMAGNIAQITIPVNKAGFAAGLYTVVVTDGKMPQYAKVLVYR